MRYKLFAFSLILSLLFGCDYVNYQQGKSLFEANCGTCHMKDGSGVSKLYPSLNKLKNNADLIESIPCIIRNGLKRDQSLIEMAGLSHLSDVEINNIVNYLVIDLNGLDKTMTIDETSAKLKSCSK